MLQKMCYATRGLGLVPASAFDEHRQTKSKDAHLAILDSINSVATVMPLFVLERPAFDLFYGKDESSQVLAGNLLSRTF